MINMRKAFTPAAIAICCAGIATLMTASPAEAKSHNNANQNNGGQKETITFDNTAVFHYFDNSPGASTTLNTTPGTYKNQTVQLEGAGSPQVKITYKVTGTTTTIYVSGKKAGLLNGFFQSIVKSDPSLCGNPVCQPTTDKYTPPSKPHTPPYTPPKGNPPQQPPQGKPPLLQQVKEYFCANGLHYTLKQLVELAKSGGTECKTPPETTFCVVGQNGIRQYMQLTLWQIKQALKQGYGCNQQVITPPEEHHQTTPCIPQVEPPCHPQQSNPCHPQQSNPCDNNGGGYQKNQHDWSKGQPSGGSHCYHAPQGHTNHPCFG